jgi:hypothetical protein
MLIGNRRARVFFIAFLAFLFITSCCSDRQAPGGPTNAASIKYFDAHNHDNGILPFYAYADLEAFIKDPRNPQAVSAEQRKRLWKNLVSAVESAKTKALKNCETETLEKCEPLNARYMPGALDTIQLYGHSETLSDAQINGALERVLTSTPWTEFDSAYAFRGTVADVLSPKGRDPAVLNRQLCEATVLELADTDTTYSEQFVAFVNSKLISKMDRIHCFMQEPKALSDQKKLNGKPAPTINVLLMTSTNDLGATDDGQSTMLYVNGSCKPQKLTAQNTEVLRNALLGKDSDGKELIKPEERQDFYDHVVGIDTAGPEFTCFTGKNPPALPGTGMEIYKRWVRAVYSAARERRSAGWHGKLLVHTHVGEGGTKYDIPLDETWAKAMRKPPEKCADQKSPEENRSQPSHSQPNPKDVFQTFPKILMDQAVGQPLHVVQANRNIKALLGAVRELKSEIKDLDDFIVFRFGHVTQADFGDALDMKNLEIEADINLESNIATGAYYVKQLTDLQGGKLSEAQQFEYNDMVRKVLVGKPEEILSNHPLKYMLLAGVRTLLGSDGGGEEHSSIAREYDLTQKLITYWKTRDPAFKGHDDLSLETIRKNVQAHLKDMKQDRKVQ